MSVPLPPDEQERLRDLAEYDILDTEPEKAFDDIARLAGRLCGCPIAAVTFLDHDRQWFKSVSGADLAQTPRDISFCAHAILGPGLMHVTDAALDPGFRDNPLVTGPMGLRFYAGAPLMTAEGHALGTLCVLDRFPRELSAEQREALEHLSRIVVTQLDLRRLAAQQRRALAEQAGLSDALRERERRLRTLADNAPVMIARVDAARRYVFANRAYKDRLGIDPDWMVGRTMAEVLGGAAHETVRPYVDRALAGETVDYVAELDYRTVGRRTIHTSYVPETGPQGEVTGFVLSAMDVTDRRRAEDALRANEAKYRRLAESGVIGVVSWRPDGGLLSVNDKFLDMTGYTRDDFEAGRMRWDDMTPPEWVSVCAEAVGRLLATGVMGPLEKEFLRRDGSRVPVLIGGARLEDGTGGISFVLDLTERRMVAEALRERTELLESVLATVPHQVFWKDRDSVYLGCNAHFARAAGLDDPAQVVGKTDSDLAWSPEEADAFRRDDRRVIETGVGLLDQEEDCRNADGTRTIGLTSKLPLHDPEGRPIGLVGVSQDITERKTLEADRERLLSDMEILLAEATERADRDPLTGLLNHRAFHRRLEQEADRAQRGGTPLAVAMLDLDNFKFFNDAYGHLAGDDVLRRVAEGLLRQCRSYDTVARFGGDEFAVLMPGLDAADAARLTRRTVERLGGQGYVPPSGDTPVPLNLSAGVAVFPAEAPSRLDVLTLADERLRLAKSGGDEAVVAALDVRTDMSRRVEGFSMLDALVAAVDNKDRYTRRHSEGVLAYSLEIAREMGLDEKTRRTVSVAALLHDVGKIGVPDAVLRKPGRLTDAEFEAMKQHPMMGAVMVGAVPGFEDTLDAVRHHHERWDGGGYPFGLCGEETPLLARLLAVADAFSAMTTDRPYRKSLGETEALAILEKGAGTQWDPACVRAFLRAREGRPSARLP